jgi:Protein of unknown function (DUF3102).
MRIFKEYGSNRLASSDGNAKSQTFAILSYSQAVIFLGVTENEREEFLAAHDIENMSVRELQKAVKERDQALQDREQAFQDRDLAQQENADLWKALGDEKGKTTQLTKERDTLKTKANELQKSRLVLEQAAE